MDGAELQLVMELRDRLRVCEERLAEHDAWRASLVDYGPQLAALETDHAETAAELAAIAAEHAEAAEEAAEQAEAAAEEAVEEPETPAVEEPPPVEEEPEVRPIRTMWLHRRLFARETA